MMNVAAIARSTLYGALALGAASAPALAVPTNYSLLTTVAIPPTTANVQRNQAFTSFDISFFDPTTGNVYLADRSNAAVDIISGKSLTVVGQAGGFVGQASTTSRSGPDGVLTVTSGGTTTLYAGDGNSTLKVFDATNPAVPSLLQSVSTGGSFRVDEMAYSPLTHQVLAANNADAPAFGSLFSTSPTTLAHSPIIIPGAGAKDGLEQPVWNPNTGSFFISVPAFNGDQGGVAEILTNGTVGRLYKFATLANGPATCGSTGLALGASGNLLVGCSTGQAVLLDPTGAGTIVKTYSQIRNTDEIWYDPATKNFFATGATPTGARVFDVISDTSDLLLQSVPLPVVNASNPHSITVDSLTGNVFVPLAGTTFSPLGAPLVVNDFCPAGCVAVFAQNVPEPASLPIVALGVLALLGLSRLRQTSVRPV